ncbi:MAG: hypothetical protein HY242_08510 [Afipia sp.]|nr:hypothetical protein [Afipia sp.]
MTLGRWAMAALFAAMLPQGSWAQSATDDQAGPKRKKIIERAEAAAKAIEDFTAKRGEKVPALADYYAAKSDLGKIDAAAPEAPRAKKLLAAMEKNETDYIRKLGDGDIKTKLDALAGNVDGRRKFAEDSRKQMLRRGLAMEITTAGDADTTLSYKYFKMDRPTVLNLAESGKIFNKARDLGFRNVVFSDGRVSWTYDVAANTFK